MPGRELAEHVDRFPRPDQGGHHQAVGRRESLWPHAERIEHERDVGGRTRSHLDGKRSFLAAGEIVRNVQGDLDGRDHLDRGAEERLAPAEGDRDRVDSGRERVRQRGLDGAVSIKRCVRKLQRTNPYGEVFCGGVLSVQVRDHARPESLASQHQRSLDAGDRERRLDRMEGKALILGPDMGADAAAECDGSEQRRAQAAREGCCRVHGT